MAAHWPGLLQFLEDPIERDGVARDCSRVCSRSEFGKCARAGALLEDLHLPAVERSSGVEDVVVPCKPVHPRRALDRRLSRGNYRILRKIERVAARRVTS